MMRIDFDQVFPWWSRIDHEISRGQGADVTSLPTSASAPRGHFC